MREYVVIRLSFFKLRAVAALTLCLIGCFLGIVGFAANPAGRWAIIESPNSHPERWNVLDDVTCVSGADCWAVGSKRNDAGFDQPMVQHWDGYSWSIVESPMLPSGNNYLWSVSCSSSTDCWAAGYSHDTFYRTLLLHWDGQAWTISAAPATGATNDALVAVSCVSASDCWAVGFTLDGAYQALIERWNGTAWVVVESFGDGGLATFLTDVTCGSDGDCWAVGYSHSNYISQTLIRHWDGTSWSTVPSPNTGMADNNVLHSVTCNATSDCWTVGHYQPAGTAPRPYRTLAAHWDGVSWSIIGSPSKNTNSQLAAVSCASPTDCWAVGFYDFNYVARSLIEHWDGTSWSIVNSPTKPGTSIDLLDGITCTSTDCWAVGSYLNDAAAPPFPVYQTLIEKYSLTMPPLTQIASRVSHGDSGPFDIDLPFAGPPGVECRSANGNYQIVFRFTNHLSRVGAATVTRGTATIASTAISADTHECVVNLSGVSNAQYVSVSLSNVEDVEHNSGTVGVTMAVLVGDLNASGGVTGSDVNLCKSQVGAAVTEHTFRDDVNANDSISGSDVNLVKAQVGTSLPVTESGASGFGPTRGARSTARLEEGPRAAP